MGIFGQTTRWVWAVAIASSTLAAPLWADEAPMMMDIVVDSEVRCGNVLLRDDSVWFYEKVSKQLTGLVAKEPVVALVDPQGPGGAPGGPSAEGPKPEAQKPQTAPADAGGAKDPKATKILVRPKDGTSPYRLEIAHKASGTVDGRIWAHFRDPYDDVSKYPAPWTWWMTGTRTDSVALRLLKWNGLKYEVLRAWTSPQTKNHTWDLLLAHAGECKGKPMCPLPRPEAQQKALEALDDRALSYLRVPVIEQLAEATIAGVQADPYGKIVWRIHIRSATRR